MTDTRQLKSLIVAKGLTQKEVAKAIGRSTQSFNQKINNVREFKSSEIKALVNLLSIKNPMEIFFNDKVDFKSTERVTSSVNKKSA